MVQWYSCAWCYGIVVSTVLAKRSAGTYDFAEVCCRLSVLPAHCSGRDIS
jgi:hypothetical protein